MCANINTASVNSSFVIYNLTRQKLYCIIARVAIYTTTATSGIIRDSPSTHCKAATIILYRICRCDAATHTISFGSISSDGAVSHRKLRIILYEHTATACIHCAGSRVCNII